MAIINYLVTNILQNIFFCKCSKWWWQSFKLWVNYPFNIEAVYETAPSKHFYIYLILLTFILLSVNCKKSL